MCEGKLVPGDNNVMLLKGVVKVVHFDFNKTVFVFSLIPVTTILN